ncbi:hypothetical protein EDWATA_00348 [Edwardsiella tarda ATCC 23685]|uniref:Uncharacterized protein n=1 Tax=Edwardsiella tarda ATCC 23685 TaxID=500638 RepID=D4F0W8_EDWTA|nr:hypothetical protein EDWATA_00348 [Edwardsiella tarda ATCC 23685]
MCLLPQYREIDSIGNDEFIKFCWRRRKLTKKLLLMYFFH